MLSPCEQEEADTRMMLHLYHAAQHGYTKVYLRTVDTDVIVLCIYHFSKMDLSELWIGFGTGKNFRDIPIHEVVSVLGARCSEALPMFHAITGCDVNSAMFGICKKTAWKAWTVYPEVTDTLIAISNDPTSITLNSQHMTSLERFVVIMYAKNCSANSVNIARKLMFTQSLKSLESIPPTKNASFQHVKPLYITVIWTQALCKSPPIPSPGDWGWEWNFRTNVWMPLWTDLPDASQGCSLMVHCGCSVSCRGNCKCFRSRKRCSVLCKCEGGCTHNDNLN